MSVLYRDEDFEELVNAIRSGEAETASLSKVTSEFEAESNRFITDTTSPLPPGASPNDYVSLAEYWWPDPDKADGLPWIRRDGEVNPLCRRYDVVPMRCFFCKVQSLILSGFVRGDAAKFDAAADLLRAWYLNSATRMNPHLRYGQFIPGRNFGRNFGIIDTRPLGGVFDLVERMPFRSKWTPADLAGVRQWAGKYLEWLLTDPLGIEEGNTLNNHATAYDVQVVSLANFSGRRDIAQDQLNRVSRARISIQFAPDGSLPLELERTCSKSYACAGLYFFLLLAYLARDYGIDLWNFKGKHGVSIANGMRWLAPKIKGRWSYGKQIIPFRKKEAAPLFFLAGKLDENMDFIALAKKYVAPEIWHTMYPLRKF